MNRRWTPPLVATRTSAVDQQHPQGAGAVHPLNPGQLDVAGRGRPADPGQRLPGIDGRPQPGDRFVPLGMKGGKLVSDFLTDQKKSVWEKRHQVVVCDAEDQILWIVGNRIDHRVRITDSTRRILLIEKLS